MDPQQQQAYAQMLQQMGPTQAAGQQPGALQGLNQGLQPFLQAYMKFKMNQLMGKQTPPNGGNQTSNTPVTGSTTPADDEGDN